MTENCSGFKSFTATSAAISRGARVTVNSSGLISASGAANDAIGVAYEDIAADGNGTVKLFSAPGTFPMLAGAAVAAGAALHAIAGGKIDDTGAAALNMYALEAASGDGSVVECAFIR